MVVLETWLVPRVIREGEAGAGPVVMEGTE